MMRVPVLPSVTVRARRHDWWVAMGAVGHVLPVIGGAWTQRFPGIACAEFPPEARCPTCDGGDATCPRSETRSFRVHQTAGSARPVADRNGIMAISDLMRKVPTAIRYVGGSV